MTITATRDKLRLLIGDTDSTQVLFQDDELDYFLSERTDVVLLAAADACDALATRFARDYDFETDSQSFKRSQQSKAYREMAASLRARASGITTLVTTRVDGFSDDVDADAGAVAGTVNVRQRYFVVGGLDRLP